MTYVALGFRLVLFRGRFLGSDTIEGPESSCFLHQGLALGRGLAQVLGSGLHLVGVDAPTARLAEPSMTALKHGLASS